MKRILIFCLLILSVLGLCSCSKDKYEPVPSTDEEARTVLTLSVNGKKYEVRYELYKALFIGNREDVDGGDSSVWFGDGKNEYIEKINEIIINRASDIYSVFHFADELGINLYSSEIDAKVKEAIKIAVEGDGQNITGHGSYENYLSHLKDQGMNYSVGDLLLRYSIGLSKINEYYVGEDDVLGEKDGALKYTDEDLRAFYDGDESARILKAYFQKGVKSESEMQSFINRLKEQNLLIDKALYIIQSTLATSSEIIGQNNKVSGVIIGKYALDDAFYSEYTEAAFALSDGEVSSLIEIKGVGDNYSDGYYVLVGVDKDDEYFANHKDEIEIAYVDNYIGKLLKEAKQALIPSAQFSNDYTSDIVTNLINN